MIKIKKNMDLIMKKLDFLEICDKPMEIDIFAKFELKLTHEIDKFRKSEHFAKIDKFLKLGF